MLKIVSSQYPCLVQRKKIQENVFEMNRSSDKEHTAFLVMQLDPLTFDVFCN